MHPDQLTLATIMQNVGMKNVSWTNLTFGITASILDIKKNLNKGNGMKKFLAALLIGLSLVTFTLDASAARLGGGASFGRSMSVPKASRLFQRQLLSTAKRPSAAPAAGAAAAAKSGGLRGAAS